MFSWGGAGGGGQLVGANRSAIDVLVLRERMRWPKGNSRLGKSSVASDTFVAQRHGKSEHPGASGLSFAMPCPVVEPAQSRAQNALQLAPPLVSPAMMGSW